MKVRKIHKLPRLKRGGGPNFGNRCGEDAPGCAICDAYAFYDRTGRFPSSWEELGEHRRDIVWPPSAVIAAPFRVDRTLPYLDPRDPGTP